MRNAFTLVEMLVAITLLAIMATMVVPMVSGGNDSIRIPTVARTVMTDLMYVQNAAITRQRTMWVFFISEGDKKGYAVVQSDNQGPLTAPSWSQATGQSNYTGTFLKQPTTNSRFFVHFGEGAPSPLDRARLASVTEGANPGTTISAFGFNPLGEPVKVSGTIVQPLLQDIVITITNAAKDVTTALHISPLTGEITSP